MRGKYLFVLAIVFIFALGAVSAAENATDDTLSSTSGDVLHKSYYYDADGNEHEDDTVITEDVVKYYGDKDTKFKVKVLDNNHKEEKGVYVTFGEVNGKSSEKASNSHGNVYFPINYKVGKHQVETKIMAKDGKCYWSAANTVKIKSTITPKELVKFSTDKKKFQVKFLTTKGKPLVNKTVKFTIKGKVYKVKTNSKGIAKIKSTSYKVGKVQIKAYNPKTTETRKLNVIVLKKSTQKVNIRIDDPTTYFPVAKLKNGDSISTMYETKHRQYEPGVYVESFYKGLEAAKHTKLVKAKFFFKDKKTGKVITKTSSEVKNGAIVIDPISGYSPYKATVWYKDVLKA